MSKQHTPLVHLGVELNNEEAQDVIDTLQDLADSQERDIERLAEALRVARDRLDGIEVEALRVVRDLLYGIKTARSRSYDLHYYVEGSARAGVREIDAALREAGVES